MNHQIISPLRYPGGKTKYWRLFQSIFNQNKITVDTFVEPFCGGAGLGLTLLKNQIVKNLILNEIDYFIYNFWYIVLNKPLELISIIKKEPITIESFRHWKRIYNDEKFAKSLTNTELAYAFFFINRTTRSGIFSAGVIGGWEQNGNYLIDARFKKDSLIDKIHFIASYKNHISIHNDDFETFTKNVMLKNFEYQKDELIIYFDPPYYDIGRMLYKKYFNSNEHQRLKILLEKIQNSSWVLSYNKLDSILELYKQFNIYNARFRNTANKKKYKDEILILSDKLKLSNKKYGAINVEKIHLKNEKQTKL